LKLLHLQQKQQQKKHLKKLLPLLNFCKSSII
jgi:hypothetical protein